MEADHQRDTVAAALSLALTGALMIAFKAVHPLAGATTLIVSLGLVTTPWHLLVIECAVALLRCRRSSSIVTRGSIIRVGSCGNRPRLEMSGRTAFAN
jgi:hypothetical protein